MSDSIFTDAEQEKINILNAALSGKITNAQAAKQLNLSIRQVQRVKAGMRVKGSRAAIHGLKNKPSNHQIDQQIKVRSLAVIAKKYADFKPSFTTEKLAEYDNIKISYGTTRLWMIEAGIWKVKSRKSANYRSWRERKEYFGELQQFDGSYHLWLEDRLLDATGNPQELCLLASIDDATSMITQAVFDFNEGITPVFNFWLEYVSRLGKPLGIYLDKFSTYKINHKTAVDNSELMTQFQTAMQLLNIRIISANSPQAKGRIERLFQTLQDRLVKELRLSNIRSLAEANLFLKDFIPKFNRQFSVIAKQDGDMHKPLTESEQVHLKSIFSRKFIRRVNLDYTLQFKNQFYQLEEIQPITVRAKVKILVEEHLDGAIHFRFNNHYLKTFVLPGKPIKVNSQPAVLTNHKLNWKPPVNHPWRLPKPKSSDSEG